MSIDPDHVGGNFGWVKPPTCCEQFKDAIEDRKFFFVSNFVENDNSMIYMIPTEPDGSHATSKGIAISYCPFCGTKTAVRKKK